MPAMPAGLNRDRVLALVGLAGLLVVGAVCVSLVLGMGDGGEEKRAAGQVAATDATPTATPTPRPTPPPLTAEQREQRSAAAEQVRAQGFEPVSLRAYRPDQTLRVLLGQRDEAAATAAGGAPGRRAFFFVGGEFIGTDVSDASTSLRIRRQTRRTVTLQYRLDAGERASVRFRWDGTSLAPQTPVPPIDQRQAPA